MNILKFVVIRISSDTINNFQRYIRLAIKRTFYKIRYTEGYINIYICKKYTA